MTVAQFRLTQGLPVASSWRRWAAVRPPRPYRQHTQWPKWLQVEDNGARVAIPWIIGTSGWAMSSTPARNFRPYRRARKIHAGNSDHPTPLEIFIVASNEPATIMSEYARLTGHPEMPPLWSFGYQQSHRTLASREEVLAEAKTSAKKNYPAMH